MFDKPDPVGSGWYADPWDRWGLRWWDGERWTEHADLTEPRVRSGWLSESAASLWVSQVVGAAAGFGWAVAGIVVVATVIVGRPPQRTEWLLIVGIPIFVFGQVWTVALLGRQKVLRRQFWLLTRRQRNPVTLLFGALPRLLRYGLVVAIVAGYAAAYLSSAGVLMGFFGFHFGVALNELARRQGRGLDLPPPIVTQQSDR